MSNLGFRDGVVKVKALQLDQKRLNEDFHMKYISSATAWKASVTGWLSTAAKTTFTASASAIPRNIKFRVDTQAAAERVLKLVVKGYTGQGEYVEETISLPKTVASTIAGNHAFAHVTSIVPAVATKGFGTYGTVSIFYGDKVGLKEYCESEADILKATFIRGTSLAFVAKTATSYPINSTTFSPTYQTLDLKTLTPAGSSIAITYLSKFQKPFKN